MLSVEAVAGVAVAAFLLWAAAAKLSSRTVSGGWLAAYGVPTALRRPALVALALTEAATGTFLLLGFQRAALVALGLGTLFTLALAHARARGVRRLSCGCFGAKERGLPFLLARALAFTALAALAAFGGALEISRDAFMLAALAVLALAVVVLALFVLALARQVGVLTLRVGPGVALELEDEGPPVGKPAPLLEGLRGRGSELVAFFTDDCRLCRELAPAVRALGREGLQVHVVYEGEEPDAFRRWKVPGAPFAVHVVDGAVAAKGTVNTLEQLDGLVAIGAARAHHAPA
jgi:hypothetical protein